MYAHCRVKTKYIDNKAVFKRSQLHKRIYMFLDYR